MRDPTDARLAATTNSSFEFVTGPIPPGERLARKSSVRARTFSITVRLRQLSYQAKVGSAYAAHRVGLAAWKPAPLYFSLTFTIPKV